MSQPPTPLDTPIAQSDTERRPVILSVDDDPQVLRSVARDLRKSYARDYRIISAESGAVALQTLSELQSRGEVVALIVSDHRMPTMDGVSFLERAMIIFPDAKRVLLTAYADTEAAIRAINRVRLDFYILKPWDPPETNLYPVLSDLLADWRANYRPPFSGIRVLGSRWTPASFELREFLARNHVPYRWLDVEHAGQELSSALEGWAAAPQLPAVILADGTRLERPSIAEVAARVGLKTSADQSFYDVVIVGGGPAGLAAGVYGASEGLRTVMIEREAPGGQAALSSRIENYLGFPVGLSGSDLARRAVTQAQRFGLEIIAPQAVRALHTRGEYRVVTLEDGSQISSFAVIVATGVQWRRLDVPGMDRLTGAGVYYGAGGTEALATRDETVFVIGGANSAGQAAMNFSRYAARVVMLVRGPSLKASMSQYLIAQIADTPNIEVRFNVSVTAVVGESRLEQITVHDSVSNTSLTQAATNLFIFIGAAPHTAWLEGVIARDDHGFLRTGPAARGPAWTLERDPGLLETSLPGVFAVGDVRSGSVKRVASGVGEGSVAIAFVHQYLASVAS